MTAIVMTMVSVETVSAASWKQDSKGWWVENADGTYLVNTWYQSPDSRLWYYMGVDGYMLTNTWYQSPNSGLWYYMGADGHMLTNTTTPDGYTVGADGVWITKQTQATNTKDTAVVREVVEAYKEYKSPYWPSFFRPDSYIFMCLDNDDIPECICSNGRTTVILTHNGNRESKVTDIYASSNSGSKNSLSTTASFYYVKNGNVLCKYVNSDEAEDVEWRTFYRISNGSFEEIGSSSRVRSNGYCTPSRSDTSKVIYDDYNNSFGTLTEISLEYEDTYRSIDAAYEAYIAQ